MNSSRHPGLYIHVPFCRSKCLYCDFYSVASSELISAWLSAVKREALFYRDRFNRFDSLYLGGGTPSALSERDLSELLEWLRKHFTFLSDSEMTMEANPDGLSGQKLRTASNLGINRISLGVQSLDDRDLAYLGRTHSSGQALEALETIRSSGFKNIGVDLIYGLEIQDIRRWKSTLDQIIEFRPEHVSCYELTFEGNTPLARRKANGQVRAIEEKLETAFFIWTSRHLEKKGYLHYEVSNFARGSEFMCRHNRKYWSHVPYLGLGPSAHSFQGGRRWWNVRSIRKYCRLLLDDKLPVEASEVLSHEQLDLEYLSLGLRTSAGVDSLRSPGMEFRSSRGFEELLKAGLVQVNDGMIQPTRRGFLVADSLPSML